MNVEIFRFSVFDLKVFLVFCSECQLEFKICRLFCQYHSRDEGNVSQREEKREKMKEKRRMKDEYQRSSKPMFSEEPPETDNRTECCDCNM